MSDHNATTIILADDHVFLREGLKAMLEKLTEYKLVFEAANGQELLDAVIGFQPTIVITDIKMPLMDGIEATRIIKEKFPHIKVIALSNYDEENLIADMITAGADAYLLKNVNKSEMEVAIKSVLAGKNYYCSATSSKLLENTASSIEKTIREKSIQITAREQEVLRLICKGLTNKEIGKELNLSVRTVESHRVTLQEKTGLRSAASLALFAVKFGYLQ